MPPRQVATPFRWDHLSQVPRSFWDRFTPAQLFVGSFAFIILVGTLGFGLIPGLYTKAPMSWIDSLFITTSAVCVTGLSTIDVADRLTFWGQLWLILLIQLGGLGVITFTSFFVLLLGGRLSLRAEGVATGSLDDPPPIDARSLLRDVIRFTLTIEAIGALWLVCLWYPKFGMASIWHAIFHSVSAFCNAGFSTFSDNLMSFRTSPGTLTCISFLIILGGFGFLAMEEVWTKLRTQLLAGRKRGRRFRLSLHTSLVIAMTCILLVGGMIVFGLLESSRETLKELSWIDRFFNLLMMSVTPRTAGFNSIDYEKAADSSNWITILLMTIGGSPGSTAGGIKTTSLALIAIYALSNSRGAAVPNVWSRSIRQETIQRAILLFMVSIFVVGIGVFCLTLSEENHASRGFLYRLFEASSAYNTVGLSMNFTSGMSTLGKLNLITLMFLGRVGTLTVLVALVFRPVDAGKFRYAYEEVMVG
jgi:trk system potassium uptake protein TrkH